MNKFHVIIPARYHSTRLPSKPLLKIGDKSMIVHVCDQAKLSGAFSVTVATDNVEIKEQVEASGYNAVLTAESHPSGSDRVYEAAQLANLKDDDIIVNVQGDEPFIPAENISLAASLIDDHQHQMSTLCCPILDSEEVLNPNTVKVIFDNHAKAIYFSRSPIPYCRDNNLRVGKPLPADYYRHIGIYAYRKKFLKKFINWAPSRLELIESLEQLRVIENGYSIKIASLEEMPPHGVDTQHDLELAREFYAKKLSQS